MAKTFRSLVKATRHTYSIMECFALGVRWVLKPVTLDIKCQAMLSIDYTFVINFPAATRAFKMGLFDTPKIDT